MSIWNDKMAGHQAASGQVSVNWFFIWSLLLCKYIPALFFKHVSTSPSLIAYFWYEYHYSFCVFWVPVQMKPNEIVLVETTLGIPVVYVKGCMLGSDLTCWPPNKCCQYTGITLDRLHWKDTGWCYHPVVIQWRSRAHLYNWKPLRPLEPQVH